MSGLASDDSFSERWTHAAEKLRGSNSLDGFCDMYESGEVSMQELFSIAYEHWCLNPGARDQFLASLASHESEDIRGLSRELTAFIAHHSEHLSRRHK